jgi:DNA-binding HxlR family transcriptional regulator
LTQRITSQLLLSVLSPQNFNSIQQDTGISPRIVRKYLDEMKKNHLVKEEAKNWKQGKKKRYSITETGIEQLINTSLFDMLNIMTKFLTEAKKPEMQELFLRKRTERYNQTVSLVQKHFVDCAERGIDPFSELEGLDEFEIKKRFKTSSFNGAQPVTDTDMPLYETVKKLFELQLFFNSQVADPESMINNNWAIFSPKMLLFLMYKQGTKPELDRVLYEIEQEALHGTK